MTTTTGVEVDVSFGVLGDGSCFPLLMLTVGGPSVERVIVWPFVVKVVFRVTGGSFSVSVLSIITTTGVVVGCSCEVLGGGICFPLLMLIVGGPSGKRVRV